MIKCSVDDCSNRALHKPVLLLRPKYYTGEPAKAHLDIPVCDEHRVQDPQAFITPKSWQFLINRMRREGLAKPKRSLTRLEWESLS